MKTSLTKIAGIILVSVMLPVAASATTNEEIHAQINALIAQLEAQGGSTSSYSAYAHTGENSTCTFTKQLNLGMYDPEVINVQRLLNASPDTQVASFGAGAPGEETDFFGERTKMAVIRFQNKYASNVLAPMGLTHGTGVVDIATRAQLYELCGESSGVVLGASTEVPASGIPTTIITTTTGGNYNGNSGWNNNSNTGLNGGAGTLNFSNEASDIESQVPAGMAKRVESFRAQANGSDVNISYLKVVLEMNTNNVSGASNILSRYADAVDVIMDGRTVGSVNTSDFNRDASGIYSTTIALNNAIVRMGNGNRATFSIVIHAPTMIDSANTTAQMTVRATTVRYNDATGIVLSDSVGTYGITYGITVVKSSPDEKLTISTDASNPSAGTVMINEKVSTDVPLNVFRVRSAATDIAFDRVTANLSTSAANLRDVATALYLMRGNTRIADLDLTAISGSSAQVNFDLYNTAQISRDTSAQLSIVARVKRGDTLGLSGQTLTASLSASAIAARNVNGDMVVTLSGSSMGSAQTLTYRGLSLKMLSRSSVLKSVSSSSSSKGYGEFTIVFNVSAFGEDEYILNDATKFAFEIQNANGVVIPAASSTVTFTSNANKDSTGTAYVFTDSDSAKSVTLTATMLPGTNLIPGSYKLVLKTVTFGTTNAGTGRSQVFTPESDFTTDAVTIVQ